MEAPRLLKRSLPDWIIVAVERSIVVQDQLMLERLTQAKNHVRQFSSAKCHFPRKNFDTPKLFLVFFWKRHISEKSWKSSMRQTREIVEVFSCEAPKPWKYSKISHFCIFRHFLFSCFLFPFFDEKMEKSSRSTFCENVDFLWENSKFASRDTVLEMAHLKVTSNS